MDLQWAGGSKGGMAGHTPSLPKDGQERKRARGWLTICLPRGWQLQTHGCCFPLALLQDLAAQPDPHKLTHPTLSTAHPGVLTPSSTFWGQLI